MSTLISGEARAFGRTLFLGHLAFSCSFCSRQQEMLPRSRLTVTRKGLHRNGAMKKQAATPKQGHARIPAYKNSSLPSARRVKDLLSRMTLEEKAAQMLCIWQQKAQTLVDADGNFDEKKAKAAFRDRRGLGQVGRPSDAGKGLNARQMATLTNAIQKFFLENSRLGIPVIFHEECLHGHAAVDGTSFPQPIALGATFNPELVEQLYTMTAAEARLRGAHQALTPVIDVAREPRWGRVEETFGEDPFLVSRLGIAAVRGFQGDRTFQRQAPSHRHAQAFRRPRPARVRHELRAGQRLSARSARDLPLHISRGVARGGRHQRHGLLQRDRRRPVARQPLAAARCAAQGVGLQGLRRLRLLRHLGTRLSSRHARPLRRRRTKRNPARSRSKPASISSCPIPIATCISSSWSAKAC